MDNSLKYCFGIDFGTTNSATVGYAIMGDSSEQILYGDDEQRPIPSVVAIDKNTGEVFTGREAWERRLELAQSCEYISSIKSLLGTPWEKVIAGKVWNPEKVAAEVFKCLQRNVVARTGVTMNQAVIAIPIGFAGENRSLIRNAAAMAGIEIRSFISEPTAAFFANYNDIRNDEIVAVFDWGGGTLDVSVLKHEKGKIFELATGGINVAGDTIDLKLARKVHARIDRKKKLNLAFDDMPAQSKDRMLVRAERAKRILSEDDTAIISLNNYGEYGVVRETIDYEWFSEVINAEVDMAIDCLRKVINDSQVGLNNIDRIIMVGGSSNLGPLNEKMDQLFGDKLYFPEETMWNVGMGAAMLSATPGSYYSNQKIGIRLSDQTLFPLLKENVGIDNWSRTDHFGIVDSNKEARFIFSGSRDLDEDENRFSTLEVPSYRFLQEQIILKSFIDKNLVFNVESASSMRRSDTKTIWKYERLKFFYKLPEEGGIFE